MKGARSYNIRKFAENGANGLEQTREIARETAIALVYNGTTHSIMMASPVDLYDFAIGFSFSEKIIENINEIIGVEIITHYRGIEIQISLESVGANNFIRQRHLRLGPVGCGLCGIDSLEAALPQIERITNAAQFTPKLLLAGMAKLRNFQPLHARTHAVHVAAFMDANGDLIHAREDIGRHNALDKLIGTLLDEGLDASKGAILITSRVSVDLVQKCARIGCGTLAAISAPSSLAISMAQIANISLYAIVRADGLEQFTQL